jgi:hypothetical protein
MSPTMRLCDAKLVVKVDEFSRPDKVIVMAGQHMLATVTIAEVRRVLEQIDELRKQPTESSSERGRAEEEAGYE